MKILLSTNRFHPDIGGIESIADILARSFVSAGHSLRLVTQSPGQYDDDLLRFPFPVLRRPTRGELLACHRWADVIVQNNLEVRQLWPTLLCRRPLLIALHTWIRTAEGNLTPLQRLKRFALRRADRVVAVSEAIRRDSLPSADLQFRSVVIGNPYDSQLFRTLPNVARDNAIVFLGRLVSDKGVDLLLRAFAALQRPSWRLTIIGEGPERPALEHLAHGLGLGQAVQFRGALQGEALVRVLNQHQLMVIPSRWREPFGVVALEGLACGCVVLASDGGGLTDAVGSAGLFFQRGNQEDLTRQLRLIIDDGPRRETLRRQAPTHLAGFREDQVSSRYLELLEAMVQRPSASER